MHAMNTYLVSFFFAACLLGSLGQLPTFAMVVTGADIVDESVGTADLADKAVTSAKLADRSVTTNKLANGAVTSKKLAPEVLNRITTLEKAILEIVDADGNKIGPVLGVQGVFPQVALQRNDRLFVLSVSADGFGGNTPLLFTTTNCTGTAYLADAGAHQFGVLATLLPPVAVVAPGSTVYLPVPNSNSQNIMVSSSLFSIGPCQPGAPTSVRVFEAHSIVDLETQFTAPFHLQ